LRNFSEGLASSIAYLYTLKWYIVLNVSLFGLSFLSGILTGVLEPTLAEQMLQNVQSTIQDRVQSVEGGLSVLNVPASLYFLGFILLIFINNSVLSLVAMLLALIPPFFLIPLGFVLSNGYILGIVVFYTQSPLIAVIGILPHGIIELPAILLATSMGTRLGWTTVKWLLRCGKNPREDIMNSLGAFFYLVVPMLVLASIVEVVITGSLLYILK